MVDKKSEEAKEDRGTSTGQETEGRSGGLLGEAVKRIMTVGMTAAFVTEDTLRNYIGELKLPKEVLNGLLQNAMKSKEEMAARVSTEIMKMLNKIDLAREAGKFLESHKMKFSAEIEFTRKDPKKEEVGRE